jgi:hypothetical protein
MCVTHLWHGRVSKVARRTIDATRVTHHTIKSLVFALVTGKANTFRVSQFSVHHVEGVKRALWALDAAALAWIFLETSGRTRN